jgi:hypothetical protein
MILRNARCNDEDNALRGLTLTEMTAARFVGSGSFLIGYSNRDTK